METIELQVKVREGFGKGVARKTRAEGRVPAVFYGPFSEKAINLSMDALAFTNAKNKANPNTIFALKAEDGEKSLSNKFALLKDVQTHPVNGKFIHVDFYEIQEGAPIKVKVPVSLVGKAKGVAEGGVLQQIRRVITVKCLPNSIPEKIDVDTSEVGLGESIHLNDVSLPEGIEAVSNLNYTIAAVVAADAKEDKKAAAEESTEDAAAAKEEPKS